MLLFPNAKINLGLRILGKRPDGYHEIETLFIPISLCDALEFVPAAGRETTLTVTGIDLDGKPGDNLVVKAWQLMHDRYQVPPLKIHLHKLIPAGAGLGGGSADAAFMLRGINELFSCHCSTEELEKLAATIGSDCAFFIRDLPALGTGRGEILQDVDLPLNDYEIVLVNPGIHISTGEAYAGVVPAIPDERLTILASREIQNWQHTIINDFEVPVFSKYPEIGKLKNDLLNMGAVYASMSGSGSSVYGIFRKGESETIGSDFGEWFLFKGKLSPAS